MTQPCEPRGVRFWDCAGGREMLLIGDGEPMAGWLCFRGADGQWVTQRKATPDDINVIAEAPYFASHPSIFGESPT